MYKIKINFRLLKKLATSSQDLTTYRSAPTLTSRAEKPSHTPTEKPREPVDVPAKILQDAEVAWEVLVEESGPPFCPGWFGEGDGGRYGNLNESSPYG